MPFDMMTSPEWYCMNLQIIPIV